MSKLKQIISLALVGAMFIVGSVSAFATETHNTVSNGENFVTEEMALADKEEADTLIA